jgi:hypothetical protein
LFGDKVTAGITVLPKIFESTGVECKIITEEAVAKTLVRRELDRKRNDYEQRLSSDSRRSESSKKNKAEKESDQPMSFKKYGVDHEDIQRS